MRKLVSSAAALAADRRAEEHYGYPPWMLMEEAGIRLQDALEAQFPDPQELVLYWAGSGNNGGDAYVMARQGQLRGRRTAVIEVFSPSSSSCRDQARWARRVGVRIETWGTEAAEVLARESKIWVDGMWGTGLSEALRSPRAEVLAQIESWRAELKPFVFAIDLPSGLWSGWTSPQPVLQASTTLCPGWLKDFLFFPGHRSWVGSPVAIPLAFPEPPVQAAEGLEALDLESLLPPIRPFDHKGKRGHVAVVGGAAGMTGALILASQAAAAAGAGLVSLFADAGLVAGVAPQVTAFQVRPVADLMTLSSRYDALVVGPGWGRTEDRSAVLEALWSGDRPLVLDADALFAWASLSVPVRSAPVVITPHPGEFKRLTAQAEVTVDQARLLARSRGVTVVLKGSVTWIVASDGRCSVWDGNNPMLGTGGSGDCLAGVVGAFLAVGLDGFDAARAAVVLHGVAGATLAQERGWFTADQLPGALARSAACRMRGEPL